MLPGRLYKIHSNDFNVNELKMMHPGVIAEKHQPLKLLKWADSMSRVAEQREAGLGQPIIIFGNLIKVLRPFICRVWKHGCITDS
ncbi:hypothetical protein AM218_08100 [Hymenobacter sp. DG25A]|nr:hypothetical protein AM218_08100 [Hymenobacter sp. DG25A]